MPFARPTLAELVARTKADLRGRLDNLGPLLRRAMPDVLAAVWSGAVHMLHGHLEWLSRQLFPDTSDAEQLLRQSGLYGITPTPATFATGTVTATGINGSVIPAGAFLVHAEGQRYVVVAGGATIMAGTATLSLDAVLAGEAGNQDAADILTFESPIAGVDATVTIDVDGLHDGNDEGTIEQTRSRLIDRLREPPAGGRDADYIAWSKLVGGVTRVWVFPNENGLGTVVVRFVRDDDVSIFPSPGEVADVQASIALYRPVTAEPTAAAPVALPINFTIHIVPDTGAIRAAVEAELDDLMFRDAEPGDGAGSGTILYSHIVTAIGVAAGVDDFVLTAPVADVVPALGELAVVGTFTWV